MDSEAMYRKMYIRLFRAVTEAQEHLCKTDQILRAAQQECEEIFMQAGEEEPAYLTQTAQR